MHIEVPGTKTYRFAKRSWTKVIGCGVIFMFGFFAWIFIAFIVMCIRIFR